jgi:hypothetical protein
MKGPAGVLALVLAETVGGATAYLFLSPLWNEVRRGFFKLCGFIILPLSVAMWAGVAAASEPGNHAAQWALWLSMAFTFATALWLLLLFFRRLQPAARILGIACVPLVVALLVALAGTGDEAWWRAFLQLLAGTVFMGAVIDGLLLGHWYLTDRKLTRKPINRFAGALIIAVILEAIAVISGGFGPAKSKEFSALLTAAGLAPWIALGMVGATALIAGMIKATLKGERATAVQAATGFFYLAVITAFAAEMAAKVKFLP